MSMKRVSQQLYKQADVAARDLYRFDRIERYVLLQVIAAAKQEQPIDDVFIACAKKVLENRPSCKASVAA